MRRAGLSDGNLDHRLVELVRGPSRAGRLRTERPCTRRARFVLRSKKHSSADRRSAREPAGHGHRRPSGGGGGLLLASFVQVIAVDRGFEPASVVAVDLNLQASRYGADSRTQFYDNLLAQLSGATSAASAGLTQTLPLEAESFVDLLVPEDEGAAEPVELAPLAGNYRFVSPDYLETLGMVLARSRSFTGQDRARPVGIVTAQPAVRLWPDQEPISQRNRPSQLSGPFPAGGRRGGRRRKDPRAGRRPRTRRLPPFTVPNLPANRRLCRAGTRPKSDNLHLTIKWSPGSLH